MKAFRKFHAEFVELNSSVLLYRREEKEADQDFWFQPKADQCQQFLTKIEEWIQAAQCDKKVTQNEQCI